jgi:protein-export membrane protein SecD
MSSRGNWRLAVAVILLAGAVVFTLDLDFPEWMDGLLFWRPDGQRAVEPFYELDIGDGVQVQLAPPPGYQADSATLEAAGQVLEDRVAALQPTSPQAQVLGESGLLLELAGIYERPWLTDTVQSIGLLEFIDASLRYAQPGTIVETDLGPTGDPKPSDVISPTTTITPTASDDEAAIVYHTVLSSRDLDGVSLDAIDGEEYGISFAVSAGAESSFSAFTGAHAGDFMCVAVDKFVLSCATLPSEPLGGVATIPGLRLEEKDAAHLQRLLASGPLPVPLEVQGTPALGPALGEDTVQMLRYAAALGMAAVALYLVLRYRLAGLVASLAALAFAVSVFALCKLIPVPLTIPSLSGLFAAGIVALASVLVPLERLREEKRRRGLVSLRSIGSAFAAAWPAVRAIHLTLMAVGAALWYVGVSGGASPIRPFGAALIPGLIASLFAARIIAPQIARLALGSAGEPLRRSSWLLGP